MAIGSASDYIALHHISAADISGFYGGKMGVLVGNYDIVCEKVSAVSAVIYS